MLTVLKRQAKAAFSHLGYTVRRTSALLEEQRAFEARLAEVPSTPGEFYERNGYFVFRRAVPQARVREVQEIVNCEILPSDRAYLRHPNNHHEPHEFVGDEPNRRPMRGLLDPHRQPETKRLGRGLLDVICSDEITACLQQIGGEDSYTIHQTILFFVGPGTDLHFDGWAMDTVPHGYCHTLWIPFEPVTLRNGPICVAPWRRGNFLTPEALGIEDFVPEEDPTRKAYHSYHDHLTRYIRESGAICALPQFDPGDFIVFSSTTPHGTLPAPGHPPRLAMQVLVRPSRLPWNNILSMLRGEPPRVEQGEATPVNAHWRIL
jgi:ectoine hydroxylase-related dioxygenase (phytanoyl-CoA dioxygenase family)